ncbi:MAG TPA: heme exporter protein CcmB [Gemmatimonadaceae bacterium]
MIPSLGSAAWLVARKDLTIEFRTRTAFLSSIVFAVLGLAVFYFAWSPSAVAAIDLAPGVLWVIFVFASMLSVQRSFGVEMPDRPIDALLVTPIDREAIYLGKAIANVVFVGAVQAVAIPAAILFYGLPVQHLPTLFGVALLATIGMVAIGTLFASMAVNTRLAELLLPMLSLPFFMPIVMAAGTITQRVVTGRPFSESVAWLKMLIAFDIVFSTACALAFPLTLEE